MARKRFTPCFVVVRFSNDIATRTTQQDGHVLGVFESLTDADVFCEKCNQTYKDTQNDRLYAEIQASTIQADV
jgi:hypothetical protein